MTSYEKYVLILCLIVFLLLTIVFSSMLILLTKQSIRLIESGEEDTRIYKEYLKTLNEGEKETGWLQAAFTVLFACIIFIIFGFAIFIQFMEKKNTVGMPMVRVVYSDSMSSKYKNNKYLFENDLNDQFSRFDLVLTHPLPNEEDLQLYDVVVYEVDNVLLIHRIVGIEEPNEKHPEERYFLLQGDLVENPDKFPVLYSQMKAIYRGQHIPNVGSFVMFMQSPAGWLCILLIVVVMIASPIMENKLENATQLRLAYLLNKLNSKILGDNVTTKAVGTKKKETRQITLKEALAKKAEVLARQSSQTCYSPSTTTQCKSNNCKNCVCLYCKYGGGKK